MGHTLGLVAANLRTIHTTYRPRYSSTAHGAVLPLAVIVGLVVLLVIVLVVKKVLSSR